MKNSSHAHIGVFKIYGLDGWGLVTFLVVGSHVVVDAPCVERLTWAGKDGHGEWRGKEGFERGSWLLIILLCNTF